MGSVFIRRTKRNRCFVKVKSERRQRQLIMGSKMRKLAGLQKIENILFQQCDE